MGLKIAGTLDIECAEWDKFVVGCLYSPSHGTRCFRDLPSLVDELLTRGGTWFAHYGGRYDILAIASEFERRRTPCIFGMSGSRISRMVGGGVVLCDSYSMIPMSLDKCTRFIGRKAGDLSSVDSWWFCKCDQDCGGYCNITPGIAEKRRRQLADYCAQDCRDLYDVIMALVGHCEDYGLSLRGTIGGSAWATARDILGLPDCDLSSGIWRRIERAYYGGRTIICRPDATGSGSHWDLSSAYPAALATTEMPYGPCAYVGGKRAAQCYDSGKEGTYHVVIDIPECYVPPLPVRDNDRITYPWGKGVRGTWTKLEIDYAVSLGAKITGFVSGVVFQSRMVIFDELMASWYRMRMTSGPFADWDSLFAKSLSGKLAEQPDRESVRMFPSKIKWCPRSGLCKRDKCSGRCGAYRQVDLWGNIWSAPYYRPAASGHIAWGAYTTAATRIAWHKGAESQGHDLVYGDTDSLWTTSRVPPLPRGEGLGEWRLKELAPGKTYQWDEMQILAPKVYRYRVADAWYAVTAGVGQISDDEWRAVQSGLAVTRSSGVRSLAEAAARGDGLFSRSARTWAPSSRRESGLYGDRTLDLESGLTYPPRHGKD